MEQVPIAGVMGLETSLFTYENVYLTYSQKV